MSDTAVKVLATVAGLAGLGFAGAAFVGAGTHKPNPSHDDDDEDVFEQEVETVDATSFMESAELRRNQEHFRALFAQYAAEHDLAEPISPWLGCGGFGCAWRTTAPGVVLKATKDPTEIRIARLLMNSPTAPEGFVRYLDRGEVGGYELLWREEVDPYRGNGFPVLDAYNTYSSTAHVILDEIEYEDEWNELIRILEKQMSGWDIKPTTKGKGPVPVMIGRKLVDLSDWEPSEDYTEMKGMRFVAAWRAASLCAQKMSRDKVLKHVSGAILWAMSKGIMLCDVESFNLGWVKLHSKPTLVIFDPGYTVDVPILGATFRR